MSTERDNRMVWDHRETGHYEVWYATFNHRPSQTGFWIRYTLESPRTGHGAPYCQLWFAMFDAEDPRRNLAVNRRFPIDQLEHRADPFWIRIGPAQLTHTHLSGTLCTAGCRHEDARPDEDATIRR
jgi:hypothetical protein